MRINDNDQKKKKKKDKSIIEGAVLAMIQAELKAFAKETIDEAFGEFFKELK